MNKIMLRCRKRELEAKINPKKFDRQLSLALDAILIQLEDCR